MAVCNNTLEHQKIEETKSFINNRYTFHQVGLVICACTGLLACLIAGYLILQHCRHYSLPQEQRHIVRILFMIPIYAIVAFLSYVHYTKAIYYDVLGDCWEAFAIASFFTLMCSYLRQGLHDQKQYFRERPQPKNWIWPLNWMQKCTGGSEKGWLRRPRSALTWFNIIYLCIFQYCFIRVFFTIVSVITEVADRYCEDSLSPAFAHVWVTCFEGASVSIAMYALIQFYFELRQDLKQHKPFLKLLCIKLVIFLSFWQTLIISFLASSSHGLISPGPRVGYNDIHVGIPSLLLCIEMALFAILHLWAFPYRHPYTNAAELAKHKALSASTPSTFNNGMTTEQLEIAPRVSLSPIQGTKTRKPTGYTKDHPPYEGGTLGLKALIDALNPWDIIKATGRGFRWLFVGVKKRNDPVGLTTLHKVVVPTQEDELGQEQERDREARYVGTEYRSQMQVPTRDESTSPVPPYARLHDPSMRSGNVVYPPSPLHENGDEDAGLFSPQMPRGFNEGTSGGESGASSPVRRSAELHLQQARTREHAAGEEEDDTRGLLRGAGRIAGR